MPRVCRYELPIDTTHFTPLQLQPRRLYTQWFNGWARWLQEHLVSFRTLIREYHRSVVIAGTRLEYLAPFGFFDADALTMELDLRVRKGGELLESRGTFLDGSKVICRVTVVLRPVIVQDELALAALPGNLGPAVLAKFQPDEIDATAPRRYVGEQFQRVAAEGTLLGRTERTLRMYRHFCEVADQWAFMDTACHVGACREELVLARGQEVPALRKGVSHPLQSVDTEFQRPFYAFDDTIVTTSAYQHEEALVFLHTLQGPEGASRAIAIERF